jgi:flagellin-like hook-associated protein FlgL
MKQAVRNTQDGTSVVQTAEGALSESTSILQRMRDLSVQASNSGSLNTTATTSIQKEIGQLKQELDRIASTTTFNGTKLLDGNFAKAFQVGANAGETIAVNIGSAGKGMDSTGLGVNGVDVTAAGLYTVGAAGAGKVSTVAATNAAPATMTVTASGTDTFSGAATGITPYDNLSGSINFGGKSFDLGSVDYSTIVPSGTPATDGAAALAKLNTAAKAALGLTTDPFAAATATTLTFKVTDAIAGFTGAGGVSLTSNGVATSNAAEISAATSTFSAATGASSAITAIDAAITAVSGARADLGAKQNRFEHTINNLNTTIENTTASESRIRDTDMASEMTSFTRTQVLTQAGTAMLAQANQSTQSILKLLG